MRRSRWISRTLGAVAFGAAALCSAPALAVTCSVTANPIAFGNYNGVTKAQITTTSTFTVTCTGPGSFSYVISLSPGRSGTATARYLASGTNRLNYQVYKDAGYSQVFGNGAGGTYTFTGSATLGSGSASGSATLYSIIPAGQGPTPGSYSDTLTLQVSY